MLIAIILGLLAAAVLYGIFFLVFKLIWILFKKQGNFWPLILSGIATVLVIGSCAFLMLSTFNRYVRPLTPIAEAASAAKEPSYGQHLYADPRYGFTLTLYDGIVPSEWIDFDQVSLLVGVDVNAMVPNQPDKSLDVFLLFRHHNDDTAAGAEAILQELSDEISLSELQDQVTLSAVRTINVGPQASAAMVSGNVVSDNSGESYPFVLLVSQEGQTVYYVFGVGQHSTGSGIETAKSFRLTTPVAAATDTAL